MSYALIETSHRALLGIIVIALGAGCSSGESSRYQVSGKVTYAGKPLEAGSISFEPDRSVTGFAPSTYARVEGGEYSTDRAESPGKGTYHVRVLAFDKSKIDPRVPTDLPPLLCPPFELTVEIPTADGRFDIDIPPGGARGKKSPDSSSRG